MQKEENRLNGQKVIGIFCSFFVFLEIITVWAGTRFEPLKEDGINAIMQKRKRIGTILYPEGRYHRAGKKQTENGQKVLKCQQKNETEGRQKEVSTL